MAESDKRYLMGLISIFLNEISGGLNEYRRYGSNANDST